MEGKMRKKEYSRILLLLMCTILVALIGINFYLIAYTRGNRQLIPELLLLVNLFLEILLLVVLIASSRANKATNTLAFTDVTGIKNKRAFQEEIEKINNERDTFSIGVIMFDLNNLKTVNDKLGHEVGDHYIEAFSTLLANQQNEKNHAYRVGGDEFAMILQETSSLEIHQLLDRLEQSVKKYNEKHSIKISYARGYEVSTREHYYLMEELTKCADENMYKHKQMCKKKTADRKRIS